jgi:hypothetical protein
MAKNGFSAIIKIRNTPTKSLKTLSSAFIICYFTACATLPDVHHKWTSFPKEAFVEKPSRPYTVIGRVRSKVDYQSLDPNNEEGKLCRNYYNQAVKKLVEYAKAKGADAVIEVRAVVFLMDGRNEKYKQPECADDGGEGQALAEGFAVKWGAAAAAGQKAAGAVAGSAAVTGAAAAPVAGSAAVPVTGSVPAAGSAKTTPVTAASPAPQSAPATQP